MHNKSTKYQQGISLVELSLVLIIIGMISISGWQLASNVSEKTENNEQAAYQQSAKLAVINFAQIYDRLPCPDLDGDGYEDCNETKESKGTLPFETVQYNGTEDFNKKIIYAVRKELTKKVELTTPSDCYLDQGESSNVLVGNICDGLGDSDYQNEADLLFSVMKLASKSVNSQQFFHTGDGKRENEENCQSNIVSNPAFILVMPGAKDADEDGDLFDGINNQLQKQGSKCFPSPSKQITSDYDDIVSSVSMVELAGIIIQKGQVL